MIAVYQNQKFLDFLFYIEDAEIKEAAKRIAKSDLLLVAEVDTDDLETAFRDTNHIDRPWWDNNGITAIMRNVRSTSVGDILEKNGKRYVVAIAGFIKL